MRWRALLLAVSLLPALHAVAVLGRIHPDEVYQLLEPAYWRAHGYGVLAWEWQSAGLRNWAFPGAFSWLIRACAALGVDHPWAVRAVLEVPQWLLHAWALGAVARYASRRLGSEAWAAAAAALVGVSGLVLLFAGRTLGESLSVPWLLLAVEALDRDGEGTEARRAGLLGGAALGLAVVARYGSAVMVLTALGWLAARRRWAVLGWTVVAGGAVAAGLGALDAATWGAPFHSLRAYLQFNVLSDQAAERFGRAPAGFYVPWLARELPAWAWPAGWVALRTRARPSLPFVMGTAYLLALTLTPHKEERFLYPAVVLLAVAAAPAFVGWARGLGRQAVGMGASAALVGLLPLAWDWPELRGDQLRAIVRATRGDATGLLVVNEGIWGAGGYFYVGRNIPWMVADEAQEPRFRAAVANPRVNRAVTFEGRALDALQAAGFRVVEQVGRETVLAR
jgi:phosphatidylinositol glycan class B